MFPSTIWTLTEDTDSGLHTTIHTSAFCAYLALIDSVWGKATDPHQNEEERQHHAAARAILGACDDRPEIEGEQHYMRFDDLAEYINKITEGDGFFWAVDYHKLEAAHKDDIDRCKRFAA